MMRGEQIYNYPLYSIKRFSTFLKYSSAVARQVSTLQGGHWGAILFDMIWCNLRYGAMDSRDYWLFEFYKKSSSERNNFFTKRRYFKLIRHFDMQTFVRLCEKDQMYKEFKGFIKRDWILVNEDTSEETVNAFVAKYDVVIAKPVSSEQGNGICKVNATDKVKISALWSSRKTSPFLLEEIVKNHEMIGKINPHALNTLRVFTIVPKGLSARVISVSLRCGCGNVVVDNWGAGGVCYPVDLELGIVSTYGRNKRGQKFATHPETNVPMLGMKIPYYNEALKLAVDCTMHNSKVLYAGVDIALTPNGPELIELNFPGGHDILQAVDQVGKNAMMKTIVNRR